MENGQELTHSVTTTVTSELQTVVNETRLVDGADVIIDTKHTVSLPIGKKYAIELNGDVNGQTVRRTMNVLNNLLGVDAFNFTDMNEATEAGELPFTAVYDATTSNISGTAKVGSTVHLIIGSSMVKTVPSSTGEWEYKVDTQKLQYGQNNVVLINGEKDNQIITLNIEREAEISPFVDGLTFNIAENGKSISGVANDPRSTISVIIKNVTYTANADLMGNWSIAIPVGVEHGQSGTIRALFGDIAGVEEQFTFYKKTAVLDQVAGQNVSGTSSPMAEIVVTTGRYGSIHVVADDLGHWSAVFEQGLRNGAAVIVSLDGNTLGAFAYAGATDIVYSFTAKIDTSKLITGTAIPAYEVTISSTSNGTITAITDSEGNWSAPLDNPLFTGESITVSTISKTTQLDFNPPMITASFLSAKRLTGSGLRGETVTIQPAGGTAKTGVIDALGKWTISLDTDLVNFQEVTVSDGFNALMMTYVAFTGKAVTKTQLSGTAIAGTGISSTSEPENIAYAGADSIWNLVLNTALQVNESVTLVNQGKSIEVAYKPVFTAYIHADGSSILGTSSEAQVKITVDDKDIQVNVVGGEYKYQLETAMNAGDVVTVTSGTEQKTLTYSDLTTFTAELNAGLNAVTGSVDAPARIRAVFTDNSIVEKEFSAGTYSLDLGRTLTAGVDVIVVACIANDALYQAKTINA
jgi:hypothetical protein